MIIGSKIKEKRIALGLSQEELGQKLGVSKVSVCGYEKGTRTPTMKNFLDLIEILDLTPDELLGREVKVVVDGVSEHEEAYTTHISRADLKVLKEIKRRGRLYNKVISDPVRTIELFDRIAK